MPRKRRGRSEGSIYFRETDNQWVGSLSLGYDGNGKRKRRTVYGASKKEVQDKLHQLQNQTMVGLSLGAGRLTVGDYIQRWLENTARNKVAPRPTSDMNSLPACTSFPSSAASSSGS